MVLNIPNDRTRNNSKNTNTLKCYSSDEPVLTGGFKAMNAKVIFGALCISFSRCSSLDIRLFTYAFSCSILRSSRRILPILASFLTFARVFLDSLYAFYFLLSLVALSLSFQPIFTQNPLSTNLNYNDFLRLTKLWLCRYC